MINRIKVYSQYLLTRLRVVFLTLFKPGREVKIDIRCVFPIKTDIVVDAGGKLKIGKHSSFRSGCILNVRPDAKLEIGDGVSVNYNCIISSRQEIKIGSGTIIGPNTCIYDHDHAFGKDISIHENRYNCATVNIGENVWIGANCIILKGTTIGSDSVIAAGSVVKGDIPNNTLLVQKRNTELRMI